MVDDETCTHEQRITLREESVPLVLAGDLEVVGGEWVCEGGGATGGRDAGILPAHVPVVALSKSPPSAGGRSIRKVRKWNNHVNS